MSKCRHTSQSPCLVGSTGYTESQYYLKLLLLGWPISVFFLESSDYAHHSGNFTFKQEAIYSVHLAWHLDSSLQASGSVPTISVCLELRRFTGHGTFTAKTGQSEANQNELTTLPSGVQPDLTSHWKKGLVKILEIIAWETRAGLLSTNQEGSSNSSQSFTCQITTGCP